ncbi:MAG: PAS domain S-box protein [Nitrospiraceae bacterium]|nr:PAS domain S-box protein [Nitrospiraceae bacterium]
MSGASRKPRKNTRLELEAMLENVPMAVLLVDNETNIRKANATASALAKRTRQETTGHRHGDAFKCIHSKDASGGCGFGPVCGGCIVRNTILETFRTGINQRQVETRGWFGHTEKPEELIFLVSTSLIHFPDETLCLVYMEDITARKLAEAHLIAKEQRWATTLESIGDAVIATDTEGRITFMNAVAEELTGWSLGMAEAKPVTGVFNIINEYTRAVVESPVKKVLEKSMVVGLANHTILIRKDGTEIPIDDSGAPIRDHDGRIIGVVLVFRNITERKQAEALSGRLAALVESADDAIISKDLNGTIQSWNAGAAKLFGYSAWEAVGRDISFLIPPGHADEVHEIIRRISTGEHIDHFESLRLRKDGSTIPVSLTFSPIKDKNGKVLGVSKIAHNITERKRAEDAIKREKEKLGLLAETARMLLSVEMPEKIIQGLAGKVMGYLNCHAFFNYLIEDGSQRIRLNAYYGIAEAAAKEIECLDFGITVCGCVARDGCRIIAEDIPNNPDKRTEMLRSMGIQAYACHPLVYHGKTIGTLSFGARDRAFFTQEEIGLMSTVTDQVATAIARKQAEDALKESNQKLKTALAEKEMLLKEVYHRTKNNMHVITNLIGLQARSINDKGAAAKTHELQSRIQAMALVHEKLYKSGDLSMLDLKDYITDLVKALTGSFLKGSRNIAIDLAVENAVVSIDAAIPCGLIINELISNSMKYAFPAALTDNTAGKISVGLRPVGNAQIELRVADNGIGLPEGTDLRKASSLGLKIVYNLAMQLMGEVDIRSAPGRGTEFIITFEKE